MSSPFVCLRNPHDGEWKVFNYRSGQDPYAPNYGCPIANGKTPEDAIKMAEDIFGINPDEVEVA